MFSTSPGSIDGTVRCWDTRSRRFEPIQVLDEARDSVSSLKVAQHELLTGSAPDRSCLLLIQTVVRQSLDFQISLQHHVKTVLLCLGQWTAEWDAMTWEWDRCMLTSSAVSNLFHHIFSPFIKVILHNSYWNRSRRSSSYSNCCEEFLFFAPS